MTGIALEGGAERCSFTAGVLDELMERGFRADLASGTSAGAGCVLNYRSRQQGIALRMMIMERKDRYFGMHHMLHTGHFLNLDHMVQEYARQLDWNAYRMDPMEIELVSVCCETGKPAYLTGSAYPEQLYEALKASCALPIICKPVEILGKHYLDGSVVDPFPFQHLLERGCDKVIVVLTGGENAHPTDYAPFRPLLYPLYHRNYPELYHAILDRISCYQKQTQQMKRAQQENRVYVLRPQIQPIPLFTQKPEKILRYYQHGKDLVAQKWNEISRFLGSAIQPMREEFLAVTDEVRVAVKMP